MPSPHSFSALWGGGSSEPTHGTHRKAPVGQPPREDPGVSAAPLGWGASQAHQWGAGGQGTGRGSLGGEGGAGALAHPGGTRVGAGTWRAGRDPAELASSAPRPTLELDGGGFTPPSSPCRDQGRWGPEMQFAHYRCCHHLAFHRRNWKLVITPMPSPDHVRLQRHTEAQLLQAGRPNGTTASMALPAAHHVRPGSLAAADPQAPAPGAEHQHAGLCGPQGGGPPYERACMRCGHSTHPRYSMYL